MANPRGRRYNSFALIGGGGFATDSPVEGAGFEPSVPVYGELRCSRARTTRHYREFHINNPSLRAGVSTWFRTHLC
jgi:hypothetical protein